MPGRFRRWWLVYVLDRCPETLRTCRLRRVNLDRGHHCEAISYCHHHWERCLDCGNVVLAGFAVPEVR